MALLNLNSPQLAAGIGILAFRQLSGIAAFHKIVTRFYCVSKNHANTNIINI